MKISKVIKSEFRKIFGRPATIIFIALFICAIVISSLIFKPEIKNNEIVFKGETISSIYTSFKSGSNNSKQELLKDFDEVKNKLESSKQKTKDYDNFVNMISEFYTYANGPLIDSITNINKDIQAAKHNFIEFKNKARDIYKYINNISNVNFLIKIKDKEFLETYFYNIYNLIPPNLTETDDTHTSTDLINIYNSISSIYLYDMEKVEKTYSNIYIPEVKAEDIDKLIEAVYVKTLEKLKILDDNGETGKIIDVVKENPLITDKEIISEFKTLLNDYCLTIINSIDLLNNGFSLLGLNSLSESNINTFYSYENYQKYETIENQNKNLYILNSDKFPSSFLDTMSFNIASGHTTNTWDFTFFTMQILTILLILFGVYLISMSFAGEESNKSMRLMISRPISRNKIFIGKVLSVFLILSLVLFCLSIISTIIGIFLFGAPMLDMLFVLNSSIVFAVNPIVGLLIVFVCCLLEILFFLSIATLLSTTTKSPIFTMLLSVIFITFCFTLQILVASSSIIKFFPFIHFELFKFFGGSSLLFPIYKDASIILSSLYLLGFVALINFVSAKVFKRKDM